MNAKRGDNDGPYPKLPATRLRLNQIPHFTDEA